MKKPAAVPKRRKAATVKQRTSGRAARESLPGHIDPGALHATLSRALHLLPSMKRIALSSAIRNSNDGGPGDWSAAEGHYAVRGEYRIGLRWNGDPDKPQRGFPTGFHGRPTWFIVPRELEVAVEEMVNRLRAVQQ